MKKHRYFSLLLAAAMLVGLFAACQPSNPEASPSAGTNASPSATAAPTAAAGTGGDEAPPEENANIITTEYASYEVDDDGLPLENYDYEVPLTTSDEVFSYMWSTFIAEDIPPEGMETMPYQAMLRETTGVNIAYDYVSFAAFAETLSISLASDDLDDLLAGITLFWIGPLQNGIEEGFIANLYDYKDYMPNYYFDAFNHPEDISLLATIMPYPETIQSFLCLDLAYSTRDGLATRGDWLERLGTTNSDIVTVDDLHDLLVRYKTEMGASAPYFLYNSIDPHNSFSTYDTMTAYLAGLVPGRYLIDGKVQLAHAGPNDHKFMTMLNQWYSEGLFLPDWMAYGGGDQASQKWLLDGSTGVYGMVPGESRDYSGLLNDDPNAVWVPLHKPVLTAGQTFHLGDTRSWFSPGGWGLNAKCDNLPLLVSYCDWFYSPEALFPQNWSVEGYAHTVNEKGEPQLTDLIINHPRGSTFATTMYTINNVIEGGVILFERTYGFPGGEEINAFHAYWDDPTYYKYDGSMQYPTAIKLAEDDNSRVATLAADISTFIAENYLQFVDGTKPLSEWDTYVTQVKALGWEEVVRIYQSAYDIFVASYS